MDKALSLKELSAERRSHKEYVKSHIRDLYVHENLTVSQLAERFGMTKRAVEGIVRGSAK